MKRLAFAILLLALTVRARPAIVEEPSAEVRIDVTEEPSAADQPFRPAVLFTLRPGRDALLTPTGDFLGNVKRWQIQVFDFDDRKVDFIQGVGEPPAEPLRWEGAARDGSRLRDGFYTVRFVWVDGSDVARRSEAVKIGLLTPPLPDDLLGPQVSMVYARDDMTLRFAEDLAFAPGAFELRDEANGPLGRTADFLNRYPRNRLLVLGHTDSTGSDAFNRALSLKRAEVIHRFLVERGVDPKRISFEGRGAAQPISSNATAEGRRQNRRIEIKLFKA